MTAAITADFKTVPYLHQLREFEAHCEDEARALLWQMRSGKTKVMIDTACHLYKEGLIDAVVVFAPNGVHENWIRRELRIHHWDTVPRDTLAWDTETAGAETKHKRRGGQERHDAWWDRAKRLLGSRDRLPWFAFASETMTRKEVRRLAARIHRRRSRVMVIFDESHDFRTPGSKRSQMARAFARRCAYRRILTGTVVENSPLNAWAQYELLKPSCLGFANYDEYKKRYAVYETKKTFKGQSYPVLKEYRRLDELRELMSRYSSVVLRKDCEDLPDLIPMTRNVELTEEQLRVYRELHRSYLLELGGELVSVGENTQKLVKLQQVVSGFLKDEFGDVHWLDGGNPRLEALVDEAELTAGKVIVWCAFHEDMDEVAAALRKRGHVVVEYHGRVNAAGKRAAREAFEPGAENDVKALVGFPTPGLDLSMAEKVLWYSHTFDAIKRSQADERATAVGKANIPVVDFVAAGVDNYILDNVKSKVDIAEDVARSGMKRVLSKVAI